MPPPKPLETPLHEPAPPVAPAPAPAPLPAPLPTPIEKPAALAPATKLDKPTKIEAPVAGPRIPLSTPLAVKPRSKPERVPLSSPFIPPPKKTRVETEPSLHDVLSPQSGKQFAAGVRREVGDAVQGVKTAWNATVGDVPDAVKDAASAVAKPVRAIGSKIGSALRNVIGTPDETAARPDPGFENHPEAQHAAQVKQELGNSAVPAVQQALAAIPDDAPNADGRHRHLTAVLEHLTPDGPGLHDARRHLESGGNATAVTPNGERKSIAEIRLDGSVVNQNHKIIKLPPGTAYDLHPHPKSTAREMSLGLDEAQEEIAGGKLVFAVDEKGKRQQVTAIDKLGNGVTANRQHLNLTGRGRKKYALQIGQPEAPPSTAAAPVFVKVRKAIVDDGDKAIPKLTEQITQHLADGGSAVIHDRSLSTPVTMRDGALVGPDGKPVPLLPSARVELGPKAAEPTTVSTPATPAMATPEANPESEAADDIKPMLGSHDVTFDRFGSAKDYGKAAAQRFNATIDHIARNGGTEAEAQAAAETMQKRVARSATAAWKEKEQEIKQKYGDDPVVASLLAGKRKEISNALLDLEDAASERAQHATGSPEKDDRINARADLEHAANRVHELIDSVGGHVDRLREPATRNAQLHEAADAIRNGEPLDQFASPDRWATIRQGADGPEIHTPHDTEQGTHFRVTPEGLQLHDSATGKPTTPAEMEAKQVKPMLGGGGIGPHTRTMLDGLAEDFATSVNPDLGEQARAAARAEVQKTKQSLFGDRSHVIDDVLNDAYHKFPPSELVPRIEQAVAKDARLREAVNAHESRAQEHLDNLASGTDWRPNEAIPEDYYAQKSTDAVAGTPAPPVAPTPHHEAIRAHFTKALDDNPSLSPEKKKQYADNIDKMVGQMSPKFAKYAAPGLKKASWHEDTKTLGDELGKKSNNIREAVAGGAEVGGAFDQATGEIHLDGPMLQGGQEAWEIGLHELAHSAIKRFPQLLERSQEAWKAELADGKKSGFAYAATDAEEGLCEAVRLATKMGLKQFSAKFPKYGEFLRRNGLVNDGGTGTATEIFDKKIGGEVTADTLLPREPSPPFRQSSDAAKKAAMKVSADFATPETEEKSAWYNAELSGLHATQEHFDPVKAADMASRPHAKRSEYGDPEVSVLRTTDGKEHILEGHHRAAAAKIRGEKSVPSRLYVEHSPGEFRSGTNDDIVSRPLETPIKPNQSTGQSAAELVAPHPLHDTVTKVRKLGGGVSDTHLIHFENGKRAVFKPANGQPNFRAGTIPNDTFHHRETANSDIAKTIGWGDLVPETVTRSIDKKGRTIEGGNFGGQEGSVQEFIPNATQSGELTNPFDGPKDRKRAGIFDYLNGSTDRHPANSMQTDKPGLIEGFKKHAGKFLNKWTNDFVNIPREGDKLKLIDNGYSMPTVESGRHMMNNDFVRVNERETITPEDVADLKGKWPKIEQDMKKNKIEPEAISLQKRRYDALMKASETGGTFGELPYADKTVREHLRDNPPHFRPERWHKAKDEAGPPVDPYAATLPQPADTPPKQIKIPDSKAETELR